MEFGWLQQGSVKVIAAMPLALATPSALWLAGIAVAAVVVAIVWMTLRRRRRKAAARLRHVLSAAEVMKEELRLRLSEPPILLVNGAGGAPTMGASEAFEGDIEAA